MPGVSNPGDNMQPSRTFNTFLITVIGELVLAALLIVAAIFAPEHLDAVIDGLKVIAPSIGGAGAFGAVAMGIRDAASGGLTSSQGQAVAAMRVQIAQAERGTNP